MISNELILLRLPEIPDLDTLYSWENNKDNWGVSETTSAFSKETIEKFILSYHNLLFHNQLRLMIVLKETNELIGTLDLFEYSQENHRVGLGILIGEEKYRKKGFAFEAINLLMAYAAEKWGVKQLNASMFMDNEASYQLFLKAGFTEIGIRKNWYKLNEKWRHERLMQYIYGEEKEN
jgi:diamine N-acetyltransferase